MTEEKFKSLVAAILDELIERIPEKTRLEIFKDTQYVRINLNDQWEYRWFMGTGKKELTKPWEDETVDDVPYGYETEDEDDAEVCDPTNYR